MSVANIAVIVYGVLAIVGGVMGYKTAGSKVSLISGSLSGVILLVAGIASLLGQGWGLILGSIVSAVLIIVFLSRLWKTRKFMPAGLMIIAGAVVLVVTVPEVI
ncbi:MAG: TMEM14 family protein [Halothece sp.]